MNTANYVITGTLYNGKRFKPIYTTTPYLYNIYRGTLWLCLPLGRRKRVREYYN